MTTKLKILKKEDITITKDRGYIIFFTLREERYFLHQVDDYSDIMDLYHRVETRPGQFANKRVARYYTKLPKLKKSVSQANNRPEAKLALIKALVDAEMASSPIFEKKEPTVQEQINSKLDEIEKLKRELKLLKGLL